MNKTAHRMFRSAERPVTIAEVQASWPEAADDVADVFAKLSCLDVIHPVGQVPHPEFSAGRVLTAWLHVTNACNLRCPYCYVNKSADGMDEHIGHSAVDAVFRSAVANGFPAVKLKYAGGEASLNHRLMLSMHERARTLAVEHGVHLYATLLSNGVTLSRDLVGTLKAQGVRIMISLDGIGELHDAQRPFVNGRPSFKFVERTITQLIEQDHRPHLSVTITNRNASGLADVVRYALDRDLTFSLNFFRDNDCAATFTDLRYEEKTMIGSLLDAFAVIGEFLPRWSVLGAILDRGQLLQPRQHSCGVGQDYLVIDQRGQVSKCHMEIERTLGDVFSDDPLQLVRRDDTTVMNLPVTEKEGCRDCTWQNWCSGGCAVATFRATGRYDIKSPNCNIYKAIYPEALRLEGLRLLKYATQI
ncbi:MAG TPA: radical SAM protein [Streptosporangiaceae bacterium]